MSFLRYRCPKTFVEIETSIETDDRTLKKMQQMTLSVWCPRCEASHRIAATDAYADVVAAIKLTGVTV